MNNREAITLLRNLEDSLDSYCELNEEGKTAFRMAIEALNCSEIPNNSDTISRQAAIDGINKLMEIHFDRKIVLKKARDVVEQMPPAQPEIIRCKDCKHHWTHKCMDSMPIERCDLEQTFYDAEHDFCSLAERRTDE